MAANSWPGVWFTHLLLLGSRCCTIKKAVDRGAQRVRWGPGGSPVMSLVTTSGARCDSWGRGEVLLAGELSPAIELDLS
jgi:hypothetical protein